MLASFLTLHSGGPRDSWLHALGGVGGVLLVLCAIWRTWGSSYLGTNVVEDKKLHSERLVADGPYRFTRNPLYLGNMFMVFGVALVLNPVGATILVVGMWVLVRLFIRDEEAGMLESKSELFRAYRGMVPRLFPAFRPRIHSAGAHPRWFQGFCGECWTWLAALYFSGLAITLNPTWYRGRSGWGIFVLLGAALLAIWARRYSKQQATAEQQPPPA